MKTGLRTLIYIATHFGVLGLGADSLPVGAVARLGEQPMVHPEPVRWVEFSPDGESLFTIAETGRVWDLRKESVIRLIPGGSDSVLSPDGKKVAFGGNASVVRIIDFQTAATLAELPVKGDRCYGVAWSPDGKHVAFGEKGAVALWDVRASKKVRSWNAEEVRALRFSPDGTILACACSKKSIRLLGIPKGAEDRELDGEAGFSAWLRFSPDGSILAGSCEVRFERGSKSSLRLWQSKTGKMIRDIPGSWEAGAFSPDGKLLAASGLGDTRIFDSATGTLLRKLPSNNERVGALDFSPDGGTLATAQGARVRLWNTDSWTEISPAKGHAGLVQAVAFSPDGRHIATGGIDNTIRVWSWPEASEELRIDGVGSSWGVTHLAYSPDGSLLTACAHVNSGYPGYVYNAATGALVTRFGKDTSIGNVATFLPNGTSILAGDAQLWDAQTGRLLNPPRSLTSEEFSAVPTADGLTAFWAGNYTQGLGLRDIATGAEIRRFERGPDRGKLVVSRGDEWLAVGGRVWDTATGKRIAPESFRYRDSAAAISPDARFLTDGTRFWERLSRKEMRPGFADGNGKASAFSPDGSVLAVAGPSGVVVWDMTGILQSRRLPALALSPAECEALWEKLAADDAWAAHLAAWRLTAGGKVGVAFIAARLAPAPEPDPEQIEALRAKFTYADFDTRDIAAQTLRDLGVELRPEDWSALRRPDKRALYYSSKPIFGNRRPEQEAPLLPPPELFPLPERLRASRAVAALERSATPEATALLKSLATGAKSSPLTNEAASAVARRR